MANVDEEPTVAERLGRLLDRGLLPAGGPAEAAERLIERLTRPARVAILGLPGSGKSAILNLLAGSVVVPETLRLPTIIVQYGDEPRMHCTLSDGQNVTLPGGDLERVLPLSPALITLEMDLPALKVISLLEVAAGPMEVEQRRAALWAGKRADILIWCSTAYLPKEQLVWEGMPDAYKDNGFLLLTKVDLLGGREAASGMYQRVSQRASGEFRQVIPISAKEARAAAPVGMPIDRDRFRESGAATVISTIKSRVQIAKQADTDTADLLLSRHSEVVLPPQRPKFELKAVESSEALALTDESLAAEAEALQRIAAAAAQTIAETPPPTQAPEPVETVADVTQLDPFPEPEPEPAELVAPDPRSDEELTRGLRAILGDAPEPATQRVAAEPGETAVSAIDPGETEDLATELEPDFGDIAASEPVAAESTAEDTGALESQGSGVTDVEAPPTTPEGPPGVGDSNLRFTARLKQISPENQAGPTGLVPLRATWKSRNDTASAMPIVPKPEPNRNPTLRQLPEGAGIEARLVGRGARSAEPQVPPEAAPASSVAQTQDVAAEGTAQPVSSEPERRATKPTSVFASRSRPEPAKEEPVEPLLTAEAERVQEAQSPTDIAPAVLVMESASLPVEPDVEVPEAQGSTAMPLDLETGVTQAQEVETLAPPESEVDESRLRLSERLRRPSRPVSVLRVSRLETPVPAPQELVGSRMDNPRDMRTDIQPVERRERPRIAPRVSPSDSQPISTESVALPASERALLAEGIGLIAARAVELSDQIDPDEKPPLDLILEHCGETVDRVLTILSRGSSPHIRRISAGLVDFQDLIMLMQLEKGRAPADDALTLLLQLRREMETLSTG